MNFEFAEKINQHLRNFDFRVALTIAESELEKLPSTNFHFVVGKSLVLQAEKLAIWINKFYQTASKKLDVKALYFEINEFDVNTDIWYIDGFAYNKDGGLDIEDMEWLTYFEMNSQKEMKEVFEINGFEKLQFAFKKNEEVKEARDWCEQIIIIRFMELMRATHLIAKVERFHWARIPIYFTEHEYDFILKSENPVEAQHTKLISN